MDAHMEDASSGDSTDEYSHTTLSSSQDTVPYYKDAIWGPIRLYKEAHLEDHAPCLQWCMDNHLVFSSVTCAKHRRLRTLQHPDGQLRPPSWYCGRCDNRPSVVTGSIFMDARLPIQKILVLAYSFANGCTYNDARRNCTFTMDDLEITNQTIAHWYGLFREVVADHCMTQVARRSKIGGPGQVVQVDEAMIGRRKYNRGRLVPGTWVFGMIDEAGAVRLQVVDKRDTETLTQAHDACEDW